jgi:hypothetical protein
MLLNSLSSEASSILLQLVQAYNFDLFSFDSSTFLRLEQENYNPLIIKHTEPHVMSLGSYHVEYPSLIADSEVTFLICSSAGDKRLSLIPIAYRFEVMGIIQQIAELNNERNNICSFEQQSMVDIINFCNQWALDIQSSTWYLPPARLNPQVSVIID